MDYKTPGVFIEEVALFPPSVAAVATAVPAFVGYSANTDGPDGQTLTNRPMRITSLLDYTSLFGGEYNPASYNINLDPSNEYSIENVGPANGRRYCLHDCVRHYFDNGGGPCYIITVGDYTDDIVYGTNTTGLRGGLLSVEKVDEPTLLVIPDAVGITQSNGDTDFAQIGTLHADMIAQSRKLQDRFSILDLAQGQLPPNHTLAPIDNFRNEVGANNLNYAAAYYPWLCSTYFRDVHFSQLNFLDNATVPNPIPDAVIDTLTGDPATDGLVTSLRSAISNEQNVFGKITAVVLNRDNFRPLSDHFETLLADVMAETTAAAVRPVFSRLMTFVRELALALRDLEDDAGIPPGLAFTLSGLESDTVLRTHIVNLISFEKNDDVMNSISTARNVDDVGADYAILDNEDWIGAVTVLSIGIDPTDFTDGGANTVASTAQAAAGSSMLRAAFDTIAEAFGAVADSVLFLTDQAEINLFSSHPFFSSLNEKIRKEMSILPPSGAVAGIYAATDRTRGVWKAPANSSLRAVIAPAYKLNDREQGGLNIHTTGKSINAIRAFRGKGTLIWGARTLAGNDNEWRYVNVRRFFIYVEESVKKATEPFVFENNDANTWIRVRAMIENFLAVQWRQGALAGTSPKDAFFVKVGLGETMTSQDILEGRMIVEIGMAAVRPAEFIILRFTHKMQES